MILVMLSTSLFERSRTFMNVFERSLTCIVRFYSTKVQKFPKNSKKLKKIYLNQILY